MTEERGLVPHEGNVPSLAVMEEVKRVNAICDTVRSVAQTLQAQLMESCWKIRRELDGDRERFSFVLLSHTDLEPDRAWLMAETWDSARKSRELQALASQKPSEALRLVSQFVEAGVTDELQALSDDDREAAQLVALSPRKRTAKIRDLIAEAKAARQGHHPADLERIRAAETERDAAVEALDKERQMNLGGQSPERQALNALRDAEKRLAQAREAVKPLLAAADMAYREEVLRLTDLTMTTVERLHGEVYEAQDQAGEGDPTA